MVESSNNKVFLCAPNIHLTLKTINLTPRAARLMLVRNGNGDVFDNREAVCQRLLTAMLEVPRQYRLGHGAAFTSSGNSILPVEQLRSLIMNMTPAEAKRSDRIAQKQKNGRVDEVRSSHTVSDLVLVRHIRRLAKPTDVICKQRYYWKQA